jgi:AraC-like DNA-binding protein
MEKLAYYLQIGTTTSSAVFAIVFVFYNWNKKLFNKLLSLQFLVFSFGLFIYFLSLNNFFTLFPHLSRIGLLCVLLIPPIQFLAIQRGLIQSKLQWKDVLHFIPALMYIVNFFNYFLLSGPEKLLLLENNSIAEFKEGLLPAFFMPSLSILQTTFYLVWYGLMVKKIKATIQSPDLRNFIFFIMIHMVTHYMPVIMVVLYYHDEHAITSWLPVIYALLTIGFFFKILATPEWLFYQKTAPKEPVVAPKISVVSKREISPLEAELVTKLSPKKLQLTTEELRLFERYTAIVEAERLFLDPTFSQKGVAEKLGVSEYKIRLLLDKAYGIKFSEFTNYRRTYFLLNEMRKNPQWQRYSFVAIARKLGYMSANSFYMNFKRITGVTPKEYFNSEN